MLLLRAIPLVPLMLSQLLFSLLRPRHEARPGPKRSYDC